MDTLRPGCFIWDDFSEALARCIFSKGCLCGTADHRGTKMRGDSVQESESTSNSRVFACEVLILLFVDVENSPCTQLY